MHWETLEPGNQTHTVDSLHFPVVASHTWEFWVQDRGKHIEGCVGATRPGFGCSFWGFTWWQAG